MPRCWDQMIAGQYAGGVEKQSCDFVENEGAALLAAVSERTMVPSVERDGARSSR